MKITGTYWSNELLPVQTLALQGILTWLVTLQKAGINSPCYRLSQGELSDVLLSCPRKAYSKGLILNDVAVDCSQLFKTWGFLQQMLRHCFTKQDMERSAFILMITTIVIVQYLSNLSQGCATLSSSHLLKPPSYHNNPQNSLL